MRNETKPISDNEVKIMDLINLWKRSAIGVEMKCGLAMTVKNNDLKLANWQIKMYGTDPR